jgi:hypothetical protein
MQNILEVYKNGRTGKVFIYLDETKDDKLLLINPDGGIYCYERDLFGEIEEWDEAFSIKSMFVDIEEEDQIPTKNSITDVQFQAYKRYKSYRTEEIVEKYEEYFDGLTESGKKDFLKNLQNQINSNEFLV